MLDIFNNKKIKKLEESLAVAHKSIMKLYDDQVVLEKEVEGLKLLIMGFPGLKKDIQNA